MFNQNSDTDLITEMLVENFKYIHDILPKENFVTHNRPKVGQSLCPRQIGLGMNVKPFPIDRSYSMSYYANIGFALENILLERYQAAKQLVISQWRIPDQLLTFGLNMGGVIDAILKINDTLILIDFKSVGSIEDAPSIPLEESEVSDLINGNTITITGDDARVRTSVAKGYKEAHLSQVQLYSAITGLDCAYLQLLSRKVQDKFSMDISLPTTKFVPVPTSPAILQKRVAVVFYGLLCHEHGILPDKLLNIKKTVCKDAFCNFYEYCWGEKFFDTTLKAVSEEDNMILKKQAFKMAEEYLSTRPQRLELTKKLLKI